MSATTLDNPAAVEERLAAIESDLAERQGDLEEAALGWFLRKREKEKKRAEAFLLAEGTVAERQAVADEATAEIGKAEEASYEALRAVCRVLDTRAAIGMSLLKSQARTG